MKGENNQNLGKNLPYNESWMTEKQFINFLMKSHELDPENFKIGNVVIAGDDGPKNWPVVIGEHPLKRMDERTFMIPDDIMRKTIDMLSNKSVGQVVVAHQVVWDNDARKAVGQNGDGKKITTIKDEASNMVYVFECGFNYIRLVTLWMGKVGKFIAHDSAVILIDKDGNFHIEA